jgi:hypothetical protein
MFLKKERGVHNTPLYNSNILIVFTTRRYCYLATSIARVSLIIVTSILPG